MSYRGDKSRESQIYVGNLPPDVKNKDVEDLFYKYGKITFINLKDRNTPPFAFIEFDDPRDADDAIRDKDGYNYDGYTLRVERPRGTDKGKGSSSRYDSIKYDSKYVSKGYVRGRGKSTGIGGQKRTDYRIMVTGLPASGSWQDLKDHLREAGDIAYADTFGDGTGIVEFLQYDDMKYAIKKLDDSKFKSHEGETSFIRIREDRKGRSRSHSRSRSRSRSTSRRRYR